MLPLNREENFLAEIAGDPDANEEMIPRTRKEIRLNEIANRIGSLGGSGFDAVVLKYHDGDNTYWRAVTGDYTAMYNKLMRDIPVFICIYEHGEDDQGLTHVCYNFLMAEAVGIFNEYVFFATDGDFLIWDSENNITTPLQ